MQYRREIDGLRAVAVIPVIFFHAGITVFSGGYVGVDVFFVISGYLITSIIISELEQGTFSILRFYERRARRILPALFFVMLLCIPIAFVWMLPSQFKGFSQSIIAVTFFASNILFYWKSGYFSADSEEIPLLHTWSLAVEEQYYVVFPIFLIVLWRFGRNSLFFGIIAISIISLLLSEWGWRHEPDANFYLAATRAWELLAGSICAFLLVGKAQKSSNALSAIGLGLILFSIFYYDRSTPFPSVYALAPVVGTALILIYGTPETWVAKLLSLKAFVGIGLISYSAYLWHQPLFAFARIRSPYVPEQWLMLTLAIASLVLAYLTWKYVEHPFRRRIAPALNSQLAIFGVASVFGAVFLAFGLYGHVNDGLKSRFTPLAGYSAIEDKFSKIDNGWCFYSIDTLFYLKGGSQGLDCSIGADSSQKRGVLFGDSFAGQYEPFWETVGTKLGIKIQSITTNWCYPSMSDGFTGPTTSRAYTQCMFNRDYFGNFIEDFDFVIIGGNWSAVMQQQKLDEVIDLIDHTAKDGRKLIIVMPSPELIDNKSIQNFIYRPSPDIKFIGSPDEPDAIIANQILSSATDKFENAFFLERHSLFWIDGLPSALTNDGLPYSSDGRHISIYGSKKAAETFLQSTTFSQIEALNDSNFD